jgi:dTDP-4-amino-4,6-dideoxygalactose transaminase
MIYYPFPLHKMKILGEGRSRVHDSAGNAERAALEVFSLLMEPLMRNEDIQTILQAIRSFPG